jgi:hypothetical protein
MVPLNGVKSAINENVTFFPPNLRKSSLNVKVDFSHTSSVCQYVIYFKQVYAELQETAIILHIV